MTKTYIRHDAHDLRDRIHLVLSREPHLLGKQIRAEVIDREVLLTGSVRTYFQKQMAQESLRAIEGLGPIRNQLCVSASAVNALSEMVMG
ncbi:MAG: BON domain-containing protein [Candidatus Saccharimonas sp.]|nr:BON domain-containing protein [Planctomycetaceae bacterium]